MIRQYKFSILSNNDEKIWPHWAYRFYAFLLENVSEDYADFLHLQGEKPISQYIYYNRNRNQSIWTVNLLNELAVNNFSPILDTLKEVSLNTQRFIVEKLKLKTIENNIELLEPSSEILNYNYSLNFLTPTSFKQDGNYVIFPQVSLIMHSLINKWNFATPDYLIEDDDAFNLLLRGLRIKSYRLHSSVFPLKNVNITGFSGSITLNSHLSIPMLEIFKLLINFSQYSGIGVKTALGMGGIQLN